MEQGHRHFTRRLGIASLVGSGVSGLVAIALIQGYNLHLEIDLKPSVQQVQIDGGADTPALQAAEVAAPVAGKLEPLANRS